MKINLREKCCLLFDCDGVIWRGGKAINGAINTLERLEEQGYKLGFVTNNSSLSRKGFYRKFLLLGFNPKNFFIINSAYGAALYLKEKDFRRVFMIGEAGLREELELHKIYVTEEYEASLQAVCIGWDRQMTWTKLADAMRVILDDGGFFLGTNPDNSYPIENRLVPGAGAGISALATACDKEPDLIIGKPDPFLLNLALKEMGCSDPKKAVCVGDRLSTDILAGIKAGMDTILVKTGISDNRLKKTIYPTLEISSIREIINL